MRHFAVIALALTALATPAISSHTPASNLQRAQNNVAALDREVDQVRNPHVRAQLEERVDRIERLLRRIERSGALEAMPPPGAFHDPGRFQDPGFYEGPRRPHHRAGLITFDEAVRMVRQADFERNKLEAVQAIAGRVRLSSRQARALAAELDFDRNRAEALIVLYPSVTDPHRYRLTLDILDFSANQRRVAQTLGV